MLFKVLFFLAVIMEFIFIPKFLKAMWPEKNKKSLRLKMICSCLFVLMSVCAAQIGGGLSRYAVLMIFGALFGFLGDYFLHAKGSVPYFITGLANFLTGHIMYIAAFSVVFLNVFPERQFFHLRETAAYAVAAAAAIYVCRKRKFKFKSKTLLAAVAVYAIVIIVMLVKAVSLGWYCFISEYGRAAFILISLAAGALCFTLSDMTLVLILFGGKKGSYPLKIFNIITYYTAQTLLASSLIFLH